VSCPKVLELGAVGASFLGQGHELKGPIEVAIVIGSNIGNEVGGLIWSDQTIT
jgi:hypothetical protein